MEGKSIKLLAIEDDRVDQMAFERLVSEQQLPYEYTIAGSISKACEILQSQKFDIVITDFFLGDGTAFEIFDQIADTPVILATGTGDEEVAVQAMKRGAFDYLIKDPERNYLKILPVTVENAIQQWHESHQYRILAHAIKSINDCVYIADKNDIVLFVNDAFSRVYGYAAAEIIGQPGSRIWPEQHITDQIRNQLLETGKGWNGEATHIRKDGSRFSVLLSLSAIRQDNFGEIAFVATATDISERKASEEALRISELRYRELVENSEGMICSHDLKGKILMANPAISRALGYSLGEIIGANIRDFLTPDVIDQWPVYLTAIANEEKTRGLMKLRTKTGSFRIFSYHNIQRKDPGAPPYILAHAQDITERVVAENALARSEQKTRALLEAIPDLMFRISKEGVLLEFISPDEKPSLYREEAFIGKRITDILDAEQAEKAMHHVRLALDSGTVQVFEYVLPFQNDIYEHEARIVVSGHDEVLAIVRDIGERKKAERLKNEFISVISHELRTPLTSILGSLELIVAGVLGAPSPDMKEMIDIAHANAGHLLILINDILDMDKIESGKMRFRFEALAVNSFMQKALQANKAYADRFGVVFQLISEVEDHCCIHADGERLMQVMANLLSNASKYSPPHDTVTVRITRHNDYIQIRVTDHGSGIPEEFHTRIFQKFAQADSTDAREKGGTGLGLSISKAIVEKHGGQISFLTAPGQGTTFYFDIPEWGNKDEIQENSRMR